VSEVSPAGRDAITLTFAKEMKPSSLAWLVVCVFAILLSAFVFIARFLGWLEVNWFVLLCAGAAPFVTVYFLVHDYFKKPFVREFYKEDWIVEGENRDQIYIPLPAKKHKQGRRPIVEFLDFSSPYCSKLVDPVIADNGDIRFLHPKNNFMPMSPKEFKVRILKN
jgi:hypothetical protein